MHEYFPLLVVGGIVGAVSLILVLAYAAVKDKKESMGFDRNMKDSEIAKRLFVYAKPYRLRFLLIFALMLFSIAYDITAPYLVGRIEEVIAGDFSLETLFLMIGIYAAILVFSMVASYVQAIVLQKTGQQIVSRLREDAFVHIESLSHGQLNEIPTGTLVTRVTNDTGAISMMFTGLLVNLLKNFFVILGILTAMLLLNYALTLMVLCFVPFVILFTVIFRRFSRRA